MAQKQSTDLGAALRGLLLGGSVIFLLLLTIVWLTNRHFEGKEAAVKTEPPTAGAPHISPTTPGAESASAAPGPAAPPPPATQPKAGAPQAAPPPP
ncbi:MAG: hypothetical protein ABR582_12030 [Gemmatimonadaceae bacterium]